MNQLRLGALIIFGSLLASCAKPPQESAAVSEATASARLQAIPAADAAKYGQATSFREWRNPYLIIRKDGVGLLDAANNQERLVKLGDIPEALAHLPPSAWPYGRVVAVTQSSVAGSAEDAVLIRKNRGIVLGTLASLHVLVSIGPPPE